MSRLDEPCEKIDHLKAHRRGKPQRACERSSRCHIPARNWDGCLKRNSDMKRRCWCDAYRSQEWAEMSCRHCYTDPFSLKRGEGIKKIDNAPAPRCRPDTVQRSCATSGHRSVPCTSAARTPGFGGDPQRCTRGRGVSHSSGRCPRAGSFGDLCGTQIDTAGIAGNSPEGIEGVGGSLFVMLVKLPPATTKCCACGKKAPASLI